MRKRRRRKMTEEVEKGIGQIARILNEIDGEMIKPLYSKVHSFSYAC